MTSVNPFWSRTGPSPVEPFVGSDLDCLLVHTCDVEQETDTGTDDAGAPVPVWMPLYQGLKCAFEPISFQEVLDWAQRGVAATHNCFLPPITPEGALLTDVTNRCRLVFGRTQDDSAVRYFSVTYQMDVAEAGVLLRLLCAETTAGGH